MARTEVNALLAEIRKERAEALSLLQDTDDAHSALSTKDWSYYPTVSVLFLRLGEHMREHSNQIIGARHGLDTDRTDIQRKLAEAELAWGHLLGAMVGLTDEDLDRTPEEGSWTVRETLDHILRAEISYRESIKAALIKEKEGR